VRGPEQSARGLRWGAWAVAGLALAWGIGLGARPLVAYGAAQTLLLVALRVYPRLSLRRLGVSRDMTRGACEDDEVPVVFRLENRSRLPIYTPRVEDRFLPDKLPRRHAHLFPLLAGRRAADVSYRGRCYSKRAAYVIGPPELRAYCPLGLHWADRRWPELIAPLTVYPRLEEVGDLPAEGTTSAPLFGGQILREAGDGGLVLGVREYRAGDPLRRIHWPTSARRGRLAILEYERQVARGVAIVLDLNQTALRGLGRQSNLETCVRAAGSLAARYLDRGDRVSLHAQGAERIDVHPGRGRPQLLRVLEVLACVRPDGETPLPEVLERLTFELPANQTVVLLVSDPEQDAEALALAVARLRARSCRPVVILCDPRGFRRVFGEEPQAPVSVHDLAGSLRAEGAMVYVLTAGEPLLEAFLSPWVGRPRLRLTREQLA
jgi:uncharacterized protein (DUF58 family)